MEVSVPTKNRCTSVVGINVDPGGRGGLKAWKQRPSGGDEEDQCPTLRTNLRRSRICFLNCGGGEGGVYLFHYPTITMIRSHALRETDSRSS